MITAERLRELLDYDASTGHFRWRHRTGTRGGVRLGDYAGASNGSGYFVIRIDGRLYRSHRLAWLWTHGEWPPRDLDHINGCRWDNRLINLRIATNSQNQANQRRVRSTSGLKGVSRHPDGRWIARIRVQGKAIHLGSFRCPHEAHAAYCRAADFYHGEYANYGTPRV